MTKHFGLGTKGFAAVGEHGAKLVTDETAPPVAVCLLPGTEIAFEDTAKKPSIWQRVFGKKPLGAVAIFRQINTDQPYNHHDALEYPGGEVKLLTSHDEGLRAVVLQMPAAPKTKSEAKAQERVPVVA